MHSVSVHNFRLLNNGFEEQLAFSRALKEVVGIADATYAKTHEEMFVGFEGSFGTRHVTPRTLTSHYLGNLICVEGIVTKCKLNPGSSLSVLGVD